MNKHKQEGITLVALVVTVIILLILAGIGLNLTVGQNGLIHKSKQAVEQHNQALNNEEQEMGAVATLMDEYLGNTDTLTPGEDETILATTVCIGTMKRQKAEYLSLKQEIIDPETKAVLTIYPGTDSSATSNQTEFDPHKVNVTLLQKNIYTKPETAAGYFTHVEVQAIVPKDKTYEIHFYGLGINDIANEGYTEMVEILNTTINTATTTQLETTWEWKRMLDADGDKEPAAGDKAVGTNAIKGITIPAIQPTMGSDGTYYFTEIMDEKGKIKPGMKPYIGFDINRDGLIDKQDETLLSNAISAKM